MTVAPHTFTEIDHGKQASFQKEILSHWHAIQKNRRYPCKKDVRPQKFPRALPHMAMLQVNKLQNTFEERLTGDIVAQVFCSHPLSGDSLPKGNSRRSNIGHSNIGGRQSILQPLLQKSKDEGRPIYLSASAEPEGRPSADFATLVLPFSETTDKDELDILLLVFDFAHQQE